MTSHIHVDVRGQTLVLSSLVHCHPDLLCLCVGFVFVKCTNKRIKMSPTDDSSLTMTGLVQLHMSGPTGPLTSQQ